MATFTKLPSGSWRTQIRRKGKYASETFHLRGDAETWAREMERRVDRGEPILSDASATKTFGGLIDLHRQDLAEVSKKIGRSKDASLTSLRDRLGKLRPAELDRERIIAFAKARAKDGAGPVTVGIDLGYIKTVLIHAAAVHGAVVSAECVDQARVALRRLGLVGKGSERDRRPDPSEIDRIVSALEQNPRQVTYRSRASFASPLQRHCGRRRSPASVGRTTMPSARCSS